jgi:hypothetical protein
MDEVSSSLVKFARIVAHCQNMRFRVPELGREKETQPVPDVESENLISRVEGSGEGTRLTRLPAQNPTVSWSRRSRSTTCRTS